MPSFQSTCPYSCRFSAPTIAFGNLWHMFDATATIPGAPIVIIAGVSTNAPPEPMKPLTMPPTNPTRKSWTALAGSIWMNVMASMPGSSFLLLLALHGRLEPDRSLEVAGERAVHDRERERDDDRDEEQDLVAFARAARELDGLVGVHEEQHVERDAGDAVADRPRDTPGPACGHDLRLLPGSEVGSQKRPARATTPA